MKTKVLLIYVILITLVLLGCGEQAGSDDNGSDSGGEELEISLSHVGAPDSARDLGAHKVKEIVEEETDGRVTVNVYPASQLGGQRDQVEGIQGGNIEMGILPTSYLGGTQELITLLDTPFFVPTERDELLELYESQAVRDLLDTTEEVGIKTLSIWHTGYTAYTANKPILSPEDLQGLEVRSMPSPILFELAETFGANAITMDFDETYNALQSGAIDGQGDNPMDTIYDMNFHEVQSDITLTYHGTLDQLFMVNNDWYESLDAETQEAIEKGVSEGKTVTVEETYETIEEVTSIIEEEGVNIHTLTDEQREVFETEAQPVIEFARTHFGDEGKQLFEAIEDEINQITSD